MLDKFHNIFLLSFVFTFLFVTNLYEAIAYDGSVHIVINRNATEQSKLNDLLRKQLGLSNGIEEVINGDEIKEWIAFGGEAEDYGYWPKSRPDNTRAFNHFHDPLEDWDEAYLKNSLIALYNNYQRDPVSALLWGFDPAKGDAKGDILYCPCQEKFK